MSHRSRWAFSRLARVASAVAAVVLFGAGSLLAQSTTGKIEGTVKDQSGAPIAGAQVLIVGSAFQATTNERGYFFMNNVPAGVVTVRAQYIGYAPNEVRNVRVLASQTMTVNPVLEQRAIEVTGITVTVEQNPIVPRDQVTSKPIVQGEVIQELPVDAVSQVLRLQPGVVESNRGLSIRGSRPGESATYIDGVLVKNFNAGFRSGTGGLSSGHGTSTVGVNSLEEASVTTGATGSEFGEAGSGLISLVTRSGGPQYHGSLAYATDNVSGQVYGTGMNRVEASFSGPLARNLTFFLGATAQGQQNNVRPKGAGDIPYFVLNGYRDSVLAPTASAGDSTWVRIPQYRQFANCSNANGSVSSSCTSSRLWHANSDVYTLDGKVQYTYGTGSRVSATIHRTRNQGLNGVNFDPVAQTGTRTVSNAIIGNWTQTLVSSSEHALSLDAALSWQRDQFVGGIVTPTWMNDHQSPFAWFNTSNIQFLTDFNSFPVNDRLVENLRLNNCLTDKSRPEGACTPFINRNDINTAGTYRFNPYGVTAGIYASTGINGGAPTLQQETRLTGRANIDWQANRYNRVRAGFDFTNFDDLAWGANLSDLIFMNGYKVSPKKSGFYAQDRVDLGDVVIELGVRYDNLNSGIMFSRVPSRVFTDPYRQANIPLDTLLKRAAFNAQDSAMARACRAAITANDSLALSTCNFFKAPAVHAISPSVRVSFPITDRTGFRLSYAQQVQTPDVSVLAAGSNSDFSNTNLNDLFARPVNLGKTIMFEFGIRHAFSDDMVLDISAYNKDLVSDISNRTLDIFDPAVGCNNGICLNTDSTNESINLYTNRDFGNVRGVDIRLDRRFGSIFQGTLSYTYQTAKSTGSDPNFYVNTLARQNSAITGLRVPPPQAILTTSDNRTHTIAGNLAANFPHGWHGGTLLGTILEDAGIFATFRFASGLPYTLLQNGGQGIQGPGNGFGLSGIGLEVLNSSTMPWIKNVDLRVTKGFKLIGRDLSVFADFRNLFNFTNLNNIFAETGDVVNQQYQFQQLGPVLQQIKVDAGTLWLNNVPVTINGVTKNYTGADLRDCTKWAYGSAGTKGVPDCLMLQQAEARWGDGNKIYTVNEQTAAANAWYTRGHGPWTLHDSGFNMRLGFEFNF
jgi:hypothetical protein